MSRQPRQSLARRGLESEAPEHLLLLTIFGGQIAQRRVEAELDRRAALRPTHLRAAPRSKSLQPAA